MPAAGDSRAGLTHARAMAPAVLGLLLAAQLCAGGSTSMVAGVGIAMSAVLGAALVTGSRGPGFAIEAVTLGAVQFWLQHSSLGHDGLRVPGTDRAGCGAFSIGCASGTGLSDLTVVLARVLVAVLVIAVLRLAGRVLTGLTARLAAGVSTLLIRSRRAAPVAVPRVSDLGLMLRAVPRRGPPFPELSRLRPALP